MKFIVALLAIAVCLFASVQAGPNRRMKRGLFGGVCPSSEDCEEFVKGLVAGVCAHYSISDGQFGVETCGTVSCDTEGLKKTQEDLSKSYPDCCSRCERV